MPHDRNLRVHQPRDQLDPPLAALHFHRLGAAFLHQPHRVAHRIVQRHVKAAVRHIRHHQCMPSGAAHRPRVMNHFIERHGQRAVVSKHGHTEGIAHQQNIHAGVVQQPRRRIVVRCQAGNLLF